MLLKLLKSLSSQSSEVHKSLLIFFSKSFGLVSAGSARRAAEYL
jgi:hypothetical protein